MSTTFAFSSSWGPSTRSNEIDTLKDRALSIIARKDAEIAILNRELASAERLLAEVHPSELNTSHSMTDDVAQLQQQFDRLQVDGASELQSLRDRNRQSLDDIKRKHTVNLIKLEKHLQHESVNQTELAAVQTRASELRRAVIERSDGREQERMLQTTIEAAKKRSNDLQMAISQLEREFAALSAEEETANADRAEAVEMEKRAREAAEVRKGQETELEELKLECQNGVWEAKESLRVIKRRNAVLKQELEGLAERKSVLTPKMKALRGSSKGRRERKKTRNSGKSNGASGRVSATAVAKADVRRLESQNEELREILKELDRIAYEVNHRSGL